MLEGNRMVSQIYYEKNYFQPRVLYPAKLSIKFGSKIFSSKDSGNVSHTPFLEATWEYIAAELHQQKNQYQNGLFKDDGWRMEIGTLFN